MTGLIFEWSQTDCQNNFYLVSIFLDNEYLGIVEYVDVYMVLF